MERAPRLDASRPSSLRLLAFALSAIGALVIGLGSLITWVSYGTHISGDVPTVVPGTDTAAGRIALASAFVILVAVITSRLAHDAARRALVVIALLAAAVTEVAGIWFLLTAADRYVAVPGAVDPSLGLYTTVGPGPWVCLVGAALAIAGAVLTLRWAGRVEAPPPDATEQAAP
jgi:hypothetical protein